MPKKPKLRGPSLVQPPRVKSLLILAKHTDGKVRQVIADGQMQKLVLLALVNNSPEKKITVNETPMDYLDWETETDLTKPLKNG